MNREKRVNEIIDVLALRFPFERRHLEPLARLMFLKEEMEEETPWLKTKEYPWLKKD